jgi:hypothetical protein
MGRPRHVHVQDPFQHADRAPRPEPLRPTLALPAPAGPSATPAAGAGPEARSRGPPPSAR